MRSIKRFLQRIADKYNCHTVCVVWCDGVVTIYQLLPDGDMIELN